MLKNHPIIKRTLIALLVMGTLLIAFGFWASTLIPGNEGSAELKETRPEQLTYLEGAVNENRGKILAVVTSAKSIGKTGKKTGYELTELSRAYYVFKANGFEVDVASPMGGNPPVTIDGDDMGKYDWAFLNDPEAQEKVSNSIPLSEVKPDEYAGVYFVGGKGAMFDFPDNEHIQSLVKEYEQSGKVIAAVCHGPAALVNVQLDDGSHLLAGRNVSSFTNKEELLLIPEAKEIFPFLLEDKIVEQGAQFEEGYMYLKQVAHHGNLITGQNPWSVWELSELIIQQLGYEPITRQVTGEENTIDILTSYEAKGYNHAKAHIGHLKSNPENEIDRNLLAMHIIVGIMQKEFGKSFDVFRLLVSVNMG